MVRKRTGKFYNRNEKEVMELLGLKPTLASGAGWIEKEDGQNENVICQLKSTDAKSISIKLFDLEKLEYNATVANKIPVFAIQFLSNRADIDMGTYLLIKPSDLTQVVNYINDPSKPIGNKLKVTLEDSESPSNSNKYKDSKDIISSSLKAREQWRKEQEKKWRRK